MIDRDLAGELVRYGMGGVALALLYSAVYWTLATQFGVPVLVANTLAFSVNLVASWFIHSRWSFGNREASADTPAAWRRFFIINVASYLLNSFWVWLFVERLQTSVALSIVPVVTATPLLTFALTRAWIFGRKL